jgi:catalase-peroxidase
LRWPGISRALVLPASNHALIDDDDVLELKAKLLASGLTVSELVSTAWASASRFRSSDKRDGVNGGRIRLAPQKDWQVNRPVQLARVLAILSHLRDGFNAVQTDGKLISMADLIVLAGNEGLEEADRAAGTVINVSFAPGRMHTSQEQLCFHALNALSWCGQFTLVV